MGLSIPSKIDACAHCAEAVRGGAGPRVSLETVEGTAVAIVTQGLS